MADHPPSSDPWSDPGSEARRGGPAGPLYASWGQRVGATLVDGLIGAGIVIAGLMLGAIFTVAADSLGILFLILGYLGSITFQFWNLVRQGQTGQTVGKGVLHIRLVRLDGVDPPGAGLSIGRAFLHIIDGIPCCLGYLWPLWDDKRQTFTDKVLNTVVVAG